MKRTIDNLYPPVIIDTYRFYLDTLLLN